MADKIITGIDIGTSQVRVAISRIPKNSARKNPKPEIIGTGIADSSGVKAGYIVQPEEIARSIKSAVSQAEKTAGLTIKRAHVAIGSIGLEEVYAQGEIIPARADSEITQTDLEKVMQHSEDNIIDSIPNRRILHSIPLRYTIDGTEILGRPHGLNGTKLEVDSLFITAFKQHLDDTVNTIEQTGIYVEDIIAAPFAASFVITNNSQKRAGCTLINLGSETTSIVIFEDGIPISLRVFSIGANNITNDIALGLRIPLTDAEKIKRGALTSARYSRKQLDEIITGRLENIFTLIDSHLQKIKRDGLLPAGAFIIGGGATSGAVDVAKRTLKLPAHIGTLELGSGQKSRDTTWAVAYGLCMCGAADADETKTIGVTKKNQNRIYSWLSQFLP